MQQTSSGQIKLDRGTEELEPITGGSIFKSPQEETEALSLILKSLNDRFGTDFAEDDRVFIEHRGGEAGRRRRPGGEREGEHPGERPSDVRSRGQ